MSIKIAQINLKPAKNAKTTSEIFISEPDAAKKALAGKLFILIEIENNKVNSLKIVNFLIDKINQNYYQNEKIFLKEKITSLKTEHIFESALAKTNKDFFDFIDNEKIKLTNLKINITIGIIHENMLYFANTGKNKVFLIYKKKRIKKKPETQITGNSNNSENESENEKYNITNLINEETKINNAKLFSNVISGQMPPNSFFLVSNEALPEYISSKQIIKIISTLPPISAVEQIKNILSKINFYVSFVGLIIKSSASAEKEKEKFAYPVIPGESITDLSRTEDKTENLLTPSGIISLKKWIKLPTLTAKKGKARARKEDPIILKDKIYVKKKPAQAIKKTWQAIKNIFLYSINFFYYIFKIFTNKKKIAASSARAKSNVKEKTLKAGSFLLNLNKKSKALLILSIIFLVIFAINIARIKVKTNKENLEQSYNEMASLIEKKQNQAEANLLYSNEEGAKKLFTEINDLLNAFPRETDRQKEQYAEFNEKYNLLLEKTRRISRVDDAVELANLANLNSDVQAENIILVLSKNKIYSSDSQDKAIYIMEIANNLVTTITDLKESIVALKFPAVINDNIYYFNNGGMIEFNTDEEIMNNLKITLPSNHNDFIGADTYNNKLYLLNNKNNQIYRYNKSGSSFTGAYAWIQENINLENAVDLSIDGHIYVLINNGEVLKLLRGNKIDFSLEGIDPSLKNPIKIYVSKELKYIYILEKTNNRLIIYDKTGQFLLQYKSDKFNDMKDFTVDEANKTIYLLNNTSIYSIKGIHFEE